MQKTRVCLVELTVQQNLLPLVSGYLHAYALTDAEIAASHEFIYYCEPLRTSREKLLKDLLETDAKIFAFSCYVWNMGVIRHLVRDLATRRPDAYIMLGGPQVINHAAKYVTADEKNVFVCNGEGERVFLEFLRTISSQRDMNACLGLSYSRDGVLVTTGPAPLIEDLNEIPSPFLGDLFPSKSYAMTIFETNRGCPYQCSFCYWGRGDDLTVRKFDEARLRAEIEWIGSHKILLMFIGDANWGLLPRDVDLSKLLVDTKNKHQYPIMVHFSAAKDKPQRSAEIARMFTEANIITSQAIGIQSMSEAVLKNVKRKNIKLPVLEKVRKELEGAGVATYTEVIWPLPGEHLASFHMTLNNLAQADASTVVVYPALLLHSTPMELQVEQFEISAVPTPSDLDEIELVVETASCSRKDYEEGMWTVFGFYVLYNFRWLRHVGRYLHNNKIMQWSELSAAFYHFCRSRPTAAIVSHWSKVLADLRQSDFSTFGLLAHVALHAHRAECRRLVREFVTTCDWWTREELRVLYDIDQLAVPYIYSDTPFETKLSTDTLSLRIIDGSREFEIVIPDQQRGLIADTLHLRLDQSPKFRVQHKRQQLPYMPARGLEQNATYCHGMLQRPTGMTPVWAPAIG